MSVPAPHDAPKRHDLTFLRRRSRPKSAPAAAPEAASRAVADFLASRGPRPDRTGRRPAAQARPTTPSGDLDLSAPPRPVARDRDLPAPPRPPVSSSLDLSDPAPPAAKPGPPPPRARAVARARSGARTILTPKAPTVTLTRLQTGIGTLSVTAVRPEAGDLRMGCAYELRSGHTSTLENVDGRRSAPKNSRAPVLVAQRDQYQRISVDLRQCREIARLIVYGYSDTGAELRGGGALVVSTFGNAKIEVPLEATPPGTVRVLLSLYNVRGEFVLRSEMAAISGSVRDACTAYGFDRITWLDATTPVG